MTPGNDSMEPRGDAATTRSQQTHDMYQAYLRGFSLADVGVLYRLGPERVRQLFNLERLPTRQRGWRPPKHAERQR